MNYEVKKTIKNLFKFVVIFNMLFALILFIFIAKPMPLFLGCVFGSSAAFLMFIELAITIQKAIMLEESKANAYAAAKYYLRFFVYGMVIFVSIKTSHINVIGTIIGLLSVKVIIYITNIVVNKNSNERR